MQILNLTQHNSTPAQKEAGVIEPEVEDKELIKNLLTFDKIPCDTEIKAKATSLAKIAKKYGVPYAMIGGAPFLMAALEKALRAYKITPIYAFSKREVTETTLPDGSVEKKSVFKHIGFIEPPIC